LCNLVNLVNSLGQAPRVPKGREVPHRFDRISKHDTCKPCFPLVKFSFVDFGGTIMKDDSRMHFIPTEISSIHPSIHPSIAATFGGRKSLVVLALSSSSTTVPPKRAHLSPFLCRFCSRSLLSNEAKHFSQRTNVSHIMMAHS
jgi:hypothetical protein